MQKEADHERRINMKDETLKELNRLIEDEEKDNLIYRLIYDYQDYLNDLDVKELRLIVKYNVFTVYDALKEKRRGK
jgi:hypothetical protein